jgi:hypothetical protein
MENPNIVQDITSLPPEAQRQVIDFIAFLKTRYRPLPQAAKPKRLKLADEPFIGMWRNRDDMQDSTLWVRHLRHSGWE